MCNSVQLENGRTRIWTLVWPQIYAQTDHWEVEAYQSGGKISVTLLANS